jgi:hypothetical protein
MIKTFEEFISENNTQFNDRDFVKFAQSKGFDVRRMDVKYPDKEISDLTYKEYIDEILHYGESITIMLPEKFELSDYVYNPETRNRKIEKFICDFIHIHYMDDDDYTSIEYYFYSHKNNNKYYRRCKLYNLTNESKKKVEEYLKATHCEPELMFDNNELVYNCDYN